MSMKYCIDIILILDDPKKENLQKRSLNFPSFQKNYKMMLELIIDYTMITIIPLKKERQNYLIF